MDYDTFEAETTPRQYSLAQREEPGVITYTSAREQAKWLAQVQRTALAYTDSLN